MNQKTDAELILKLVAGEEAAFNEIYKRWHKPVYAFLLQMSGSNALAEDVTQEVFLVLIQQADQYNPGAGALSSYLFGIARNLIFRFLEKNQKTPASLEDAASALASPRTPFQDMAQTELIESVRKSILTLPTIYREAIVLCDLHEMSYESAANVIGCSIGTVRSRLHRARNLLLVKLTAQRAERNQTGGTTYELSVL